MMEACDLFHIHFHHDSNAKRKTGHEEIYVKKSC